jgi:small-conductance mechanosensitive channel
MLTTAAPLAAAPPEELGPGAPAPITLDSRSDEAIERRLRAIYAELDALAGIEVEVEAGVVHLRGRVLSLEAANEAEAIARRVEGVAAVANEIAQEAELQRRLEPVVDELRERGRAWLSYLPLIAIAAIIIGLFWLAARLLALWSRKRSESNSFVRELIGQVIRAGIIVLGIILALELLGATALLGALLGTAGIAGIALGFAFKDVGENYVASVLLSLRQPFNPHDFVRIDEHEGRVVRLTSRATVLLTIDGNHLRIPNSTVFKATITNYTRNPERRFVFELGVAVEAELREVQELALATLAAIPGVLARPAPTCFVERFGDSAMIISVAGWIDQRETDWFKLNSEARRMIKCAFDRAGIDVPEPIYRIRTTRYEPPAAGPETPVEEPRLDVSPDEHLEQQVERERAAHGKDDLLRSDGRLE